MKKPAWSHSSLKDFEGCARRYHEVKVLKKYPFQETEATRYGNQVHESLELYIRDGKPIPPEHAQFKDVADAMILDRLLRALFMQGVGFVMTSNYRPDDLYPDGLNRESILPAIALLNARLDVVGVDAGIDYRRLEMQRAHAYIVPAGPVADEQLARSALQTAQTLARSGLANPADQSAALVVAQAKIAALNAAVPK
jgi:hypothetical protein